MKRFRNRRGVALLIVVVGVAVLGLISSEARYASVVELRLATNARDDMRAYFLARGGVGMARLMLRFQKQLDQVQIPNIGGLLSMLQGLTGEKPAAGATPPVQPQSMSLQLWRLAKIDCHMLQGMVVEDPKASGATTKLSKKFDFDEEAPELAEAQAHKKFGDFTGCFDVELSDEEERINLNRLDAPQLSSQVAVMQLLAALTDKKYEFLWERADSNKVKATPSETIVALRDWADEDETGSQLNLSGQGETFVKGFSDENGPYVKLEPRYKAKNGRYDSLDELYLVHGVNDRFMAAFKDKLTVYPDVNSRMNINTDDPILLELAIRSVADPAKPDARLSDPLFIDTLIGKIRTARVLSLFGMSVVDFVNIVAASGVATNPTITNNAQNQRIVGDKSTTYRIKSHGQAGDVSRTLSAVVRLDDGMGRLVYYREE